MKSFLFTSTFTYLKHLQGFAPSGLRLTHSLPSASNNSDFSGVSEGNAAWSWIRHRGNTLTPTIKKKVIVNNVCWLWSCGLTWEQHREWSFILKLLPCVWLPSLAAVGCRDVSDGEGSCGAGGANMCLQVWTAACCCGDFRFYCCIFDLTAAVWNQKDEKTFLLLITSSVCSANHGAE